ncbi:MAG TPA: DUF4123 domain-containing protein [Terriglobia bacterium]|nr:DUF4123 domain-containing protein [Terriglobia bacterium]
MAQPLLPQILEALWSKELSRAYRVWAVLDGARDKRVYSAVVGCYTDNCCLYSGDLPSELKLAAPYLVSLDPEDRTTRYILRHAWGNSWGIFLRSTASMETLRRHMKGLLMVKDYKGRRLFFRFYDPRVLRVYLPTCWPAELEQVFGPVKAYLLEGAEEGTVVQYRVDERGLVEKVARLEAPPEIQGSDREGTDAVGAR